MAAGPHGCVFDVVGKPAVWVGTDRLACWRPLLGFPRLVSSDRPTLREQSVFGCAVQVGFGRAPRHNISVEPGERSSPVLGVHPGEHRGPEATLATTLPAPE